MRFITNLFDSAYNPGFYATMRERRGISAVAHLLIVALICTVLYVVLVYPTLVKVRDTIVAIPDKVAQMYPDEMVFVVEKGTASVMGIEEPVIIPVFDSENGFDTGIIPEGVNVEGLQPKDVAGKNFIVDTQTPFSIELLKERNGFAWASKEGVYSIDEKGEIKGFAYGPEASFTLSKTMVNTALATVQPYYSMVLPVIVGFLALFMLLGIWIGYLFFGLFIGLLVKLYYSFFLQNPIPYSQAYKTGLFAMTAPIFLYTIASVYGLYYTFAFTAATLFVVIINTYAHRKTNDELPTAQIQGAVTREETPQV